VNYEIRFHPEVKREFFALDKSIMVLVSKQLAKLESAPELGEELGNKNGMDLSGLRKLYAAKKQIRIVYEIENGEIVVYIVAIGKREEMQVYKDALKRLDRF
jgi:mRNA interferase RelE/StbE